MSTSPRTLLVSGALALATGAGFVAASAAAQAAPTESKPMIYVLYNKSSAAHRAYVEDLFKRFNRLGFTDRMKSKGVGWVEAGYASAGSMTSYLHIGPDEIIYFGILMADKNERPTREMFRAHIPVTESDDEKSMRQKADETSHKFYYELADVMDHLTNSTKWKRQQLLIDPTTDKAGLIKVTLDGKDITDNKSYFNRPPFKRQKINTAMVSGSSAFWKRIGADESGSSSLGGGRTAVWVKKGPRKLIFEMGSSLTDYKTYLATYSPSTSKVFINPTKPSFAYPEIQGNGVYCLPLKMVLQELNLGYGYELNDFTVNISKRGAGAPKVKAPKAGSKLTAPVTPASPATPSGAPSTSASPDTKAEVKP